MITAYAARVKAKPFLKWAGGKTQLLPTLESFLPASLRAERNVTYIEPFVGGGAMLFFMLRRYPNISHAIINDINPRLINTYIVIRDEPALLVDALRSVQEAYQSLKSYEEQKEFYLQIRTHFNSPELSRIEAAAMMIFLNRTCFNGLYRENSKGDFNVPFGKYVNPTICDEPLIYADSELLKKVEILNGDFSQTEAYSRGSSTFIYFDPPYRPLNATSNFNSYVKEAFDDGEQIRLRDFFVTITSWGCHALLSNSDGRRVNAGDTFFDDLYNDFIIERVTAKRSINSNPAGRGNLTELLIRNYTDCQGSADTLF